MAEITHPEVADVAVELHEVVSLVRRLALAAVTHETDAESTAVLADRIHAIADHLDEVGEPLEHRYASSFAGGFDPADLFVFDCVFGRFNAVALPVVPRWDDPVARADATFTPLYEGPPGGVHGAVMAACFDQVCNVANIGCGVPGFTVELEVRFHSLTRVGRPVSFEAGVEVVDGRRVVTEALARQDDAVTASATGVFQSF